MRTYLDCIPCFMHQALRAGRMATKDQNLIKQILDKTGEMVKTIPMQATPAETGMMVYRIVKEITGVTDPYLAIKKKHIAEAKSIYAELEDIVEKSDDKLLTAIRIAIAGNVIDLGINKTFDIVKDVQKILHQGFAIFDYQSFKETLERTESILYLGDNAGESVFDTILIKALNKPVKYAVRSLPIINDVTMEDAIASGLDEVSDLINSGSEAPGIILDQCTPEFLTVFNTSGLVISKGQGNYEGLSDCNRQIFFMLKAKCSVISNHLGVDEGAIILKEYKA